MKKRSHIHKEENDDEEFVSEDNAIISPQKLLKLKGELKTCIRERREYLEGWQRAKADLINTRKSLESEHQEKARYAGEEILTELLPMIDSFEMAFADKKTWESVNANWRIGIEHIYNQFVKVLARYDILPVDPLGKPFDPNLHESVKSVPTEKKDKDGIIVTVLQRGYRLHSRVVRPAKVEVALYRQKS